MKKYQIKLKDGQQAMVDGTTHNIYLKNGEKIKVIVHRPYNSKDKFWCVSDRDTGLQICGFKEYHSFICEDYFRGLDTKERALWTTVAKLNSYLCDRGKTFAEFKQKRMNEVNNV